MKRVYRLNESDLHRMVENSIKRIIKESTTDSTDLAAWERCKETAGTDTMLDELEKWLDADEYHEFLEHMDNYYELGLFDNEEEDEF